MEAAVRARPPAPTGISAQSTGISFRTSPTSIRQTAIEGLVTRNLSRTTRMLFCITRIRIPAGRISARLTAIGFPSNGNVFQLGAKPIRSTPIEIAAA